MYEGIIARAWVCDIIDGESYLGLKSLSEEKKNYPETPVGEYFHRYALLMNKQVTKKNLSAYPYFRFTAFLP